MWKRGWLPPFFVFHAARGWAFELPDLMSWVRRTLGLPFRIGPVEHFSDPNRGPFGLRVRFGSEPPAQSDGDEQQEYDWKEILRKAMDRQAGPWKTYAQLIAEAVREWEGE
jgi:hypothetical protein